MTDRQRIEQLEAIVDVLRESHARLERKLIALETDVAKHERHLMATASAQIQPTQRTYRRSSKKYTPKDPVARRVHLVRTAANARASKPVAEGKGAVRSSRTAKRMEQERDLVSRDEQAAITTGQRGRAKKRGYPR